MHLLTVFTWPYEGGKVPATIHVAGNTAIDPLKTTVIEHYAREQISCTKSSKLIMIFAHRSKKLGIPIRNMFKTIKRILDEHTNIKALYTIHRNPIVRGAANEILGNNDRIRIIKLLETIELHSFPSRDHM